MRKIIMFVCLALLVSPSAFGAMDPTEATTKLYKMYMSVNGNCSSPVLIFDARTSTTDLTRLQDADEDWYIEVDYATSPDIGTVTVAAADYNCIIFEMSDYITFTPDDGDGGAECVAGRQYTLDVCDRDGEALDVIVPEDCSEVGDTCTLSSLGERTCGAAGAGEEKIWMYITTYSTVESGGEDDNAFVPPSAPGDDQHGFKLGATIEFDSNKTLTFNFAADGKINTVDHGGGDECGMEAPGFNITAE